MSLLLSMSFSGTIALAVYVIIEIVFKCNMDYRCKRKMLISVGACYMIPYQLWTWNVYHYFFDLHLKETENLINHFVQITPDGIYCEHIVLFWFMLLGMFTGVLFFLHNMIKYHKIMRYYKKSECIDYVNVLSGEKKVKICRNKYITTPFLIGISKPMIVLPEQSFENEELQLILEHELTHIYQRDNIIKIIIYVLVLMNFYNPFIYVFFWKWECVTEISCDEYVLQNKDKETRQRYAYLVIHMLEVNKSNAFAKAYFSKDRKIIEERIYNMTKNNRKGIKRLESILTILMICIMSSLSVFAYSPKQVIFVNEKIDDIWENVEVIANDLPEEQYFKDGHWTLITKQGEIEFISEEEIRNSPKVICKHNYGETTFSKHEKKSSGGCVVEVYNGKKCTKCGEIVFGEFVNSITYKKCPH